MNAIINFWHEMKLISKENSGVIKRKLESEHFNYDVTYDTRNKIVSYIIGISNIGIHLPLFKSIKYRWEDGSLIISSNVNYGDVFFHLVNDIYEDIKKEKSTSQVFHTIKDKCERWKHFFETGIKEEFSIEAEIGLFGELNTLMMLLEREPPETINYWTGPLFTVHDFCLPYCTIETKTLLTRTNNERKYISVHGGEQMYASNPLYLHVHQLNEDLNGISLSELVKRVEEMLPREHHSVMYERLARVGYTPYQGDRRKYSVESSFLYKVGDKFPRLPIVAGTKNVKYQIELEFIKDYKVNEYSLFAGK